MMEHHLPVGILALAFTVMFFALKYFRAPRPRSFPARGWAGLAVILLAELYLLLHTQGWLRPSEPAVFFTPIVWTGYVMLVDGMVLALVGKSLISTSPRRFWLLVAWSVPLWLIFEAYNLRLENWAYVGLPASPWLSGLGYAWSFATIWPAIFETAELIRALGIFHQPATFSILLSRFSRVSLGLFGLIMVSVPVLIPSRLG